MKFTKPRDQDSLASLLHSEQKPSPGTAHSSLMSTGRTAGEFTRAKGGSA
jgi:hypothetical protein